MSCRLALLLLATGCGGQAHTTPDRDEPKQPIAEARPHEVVSPNGTRVDPYYWLRDDTRTQPDVLAYLKDENAYTQTMMAPTRGLQDTLFKEIVARIKEDDASVPVLDDGYWYYVRYETGKQYPISCRRKGTMDAVEEIVLDVNQLAEGHSFYKLAGGAVSPDGTMIAYTEDTVGRNQYTLRVKDLTTGETLADTIADIAYMVQWANDNKTLFYVTKDEVTLRERAVRRHVLGTPVADDVLVYDEPDGSYYTGIGKTKSDEYVTINLGSTTTSEVRLIDADQPTAPAQVFYPRERDHLYDLEHLEGRFVVRSNWKAINFRLFEVAEGKQADRAAWKERVPHSDDVLIDSVVVFDDFIALNQRSDGLARVQVLPDKGAPFLVEPDEPAFTMYATDTPEPSSKTLRYWYSSMATPGTVYELDLATQEKTLLKRDPVLGDFDPADYAAEYVHATAEDGTQVPISVVYKKSTTRDGTAPLLLYGYGSYGISMEPAFSSTILSLLDRGWVYAIAHIRGGQEMGRRWYEDGKLLHKMNTFTDFIACAEHLVARKYAAKDQVFAKGGSAGGLLMGAVLNLRADLWRGVVAAVPFVDVVTTMLDETIPLTTNEFDEWGNPKQERYYDYMLSYSPYDNVSAQAYPSILITTGLWDSQVQYYEPAKWAAKLRATRTDDNLLLLDINMEAGHGGKSGRYDKYKEVARDYAFLLHVSERPDRR